MKRGKREATFNRKLIKPPLPKSTFGVSHAPLGHRSYVAHYVDDIGRWEESCATLGLAFPPSGRGLLGEASSGLAESYPTFLGTRSSRLASPVTETGPVNQL